LTDKDYSDTNFNAVNVMEPKRFTIGLIFPELVDFGTMCWGAFDAAHKHNVSAICFQGNPLQSPIGFSSQSNILYDLITPETPLDGLVIWTGWLGQFVGALEAAHFCRGFGSLPVVSISQKIDGIPSVLSDNYKSMECVIRHLVEIHHCCRLAFINGPQNHIESAERYRAYIDLLSQYGLSFDPTLVMSAPFTHEAGEHAARVLLDERRVSFDAVITGDDFVALGIIEGIQTHGLRVPDDIAVIGFDDTPYARASIPPLTTIHQSSYDQGFHGVELLLAQLNDDSYPMEISLPTRLIVRQSCGCSNPVVLRATATTRQVDQPPFWLKLRHERHQITDAIITQISEITDSIKPQHIETLCDAFGHAMSDLNPHTFTEALNATLREVTASKNEVFAFQDVISTMRQIILPSLVEREEIVFATNLWGQARVLIGETALRIQSQRNLKAEFQTRLLRSIGQEFITTFDLEDLMKLFAQEIPKLGIANYWLARYEESDSVPERAVLMAESGNDQPLSFSQGKGRFAAHRLAIDWVAQHQWPFHVVIEPLYFREQQLGFAIFEPGPRDGTIYETLRGYLTTALYGALLFQRNLDLYRQAVQARAEAEKADQLKTQLLANVSHDLRTPLNVILGYTQAALASPLQYGMTLPHELIEDMQHISSNAEYLIHIINDLLDLSRAEINELDLYPQMINPRDLLQNVFDNMLESFASGSVEWQIQLPPQLPMIQADPDRLRQIMFNLLSNAHKYTDNGQISLGADVQPPYLRIWVQDTGSGIPAEIQESIFEPFVTGNTPGKSQQGIGLGLSITRRLVFLHKGNMSLESAVGVGSTFYVYFPLPSFTDNYIEFDRPGKETLLLLSPVEAQPAVVTELAAYQEWELVCVKSRHELKALLEHDTRHYVAIAWSLNSADPDHLALVQQVYTHPQLSQLPLLLFTDEEELPITGDVRSQSQITQIMVKPLSGETLLDAIAHLLQRETSGTILAVDDDLQALSLYRRLVHDGLPQFSVVVAEGGAVAVRELDDGLVPTLVILDLVMPDLDGFAVLDHLRSLPATRHIPVLVLSGKMLTFDDIKRLNRHDVLFHSKDILSDEELEAVLMTLISGDHGLSRPTSELVKLAVAYIHQHYKETVSRHAICQVLGISENYLSRLFRQELGLGFVEYVNRFRINIAKQLLCDTDLTVTTVAQQVGFDDPAYFSRVFTRYAGTSPRTYRQAADLP
jgi:signal transduction histidine kinase/DNA-binding LacI/PurR family transcriptional regulator/AraC-like DNA-binding protein/CheY-like chemotaxis protein